jgi:photosystem II stability/assembly factor-like uncharacterized protein
MPTFGGETMSRSLKATVTCFLFALLVSVATQPLFAQVNPALYQDMRWRLVGPFRGGRALTAVGVPGNAGVYYFGAVGGGIWKSTDAGVSWLPIFDSQPIASIGAMAVAPTDPSIIYVGSGEADMREDITQGNGMYKSIDAGKTWAHIGLADTQQIGRVLVDPHDPNVVFVAALGHPYGANAERGVFRSTDGGKSWTKVLFKDENTGAIDLAFDPQDSQTIYASLWQTRRPPWNVYPPSNGPGSGLYKSTDGGTNWQPIENGIPKENLGRIGIAVAQTDHNRVYAIVDAKQGGLYRSDDAGATWKLMDTEQRIWGRGWYFGIVEVDPKNPDVLYVSNTSVYKSVDGGKSFTAFKGAPGGDDYHSIWIAPEDPDRMIISADQGTIITLNGGKTWSSWYNQPIAQFYGIATDKRFPYWLYGAQQDSGAIAVPSRSNFAGISERDWKPIPVGGESGDLAPDPLNTNIVFGGTVSRFDWTTYQSQDVSPTLGRIGPFRQSWTLPITFSPADGHKLYFSHQELFRTINGGKTWDQVSPDLTRENPEVPKNLDAITAKYGLASPRKGVIFTIGPSPIDANQVWAGTDDGSIWVTQDDGKTWKNVTPQGLSAWSKIGWIEPSHFDKQTAYAAIDRHRIDDSRPYIYRTRDGGKSWQNVIQGIPEGSFVNVVREDPVRRGLLFAGTELGMYVSWNDGENWQPLQLNLPVASIRGIDVHDTDLAVATHGRAFWILDDISPLRQIDAQAAQKEVVLFKPSTALRIRPGSDQGTPYPPEIPHGDNPPNGAILDYYLSQDATGPVVLEILDAKGALVRRYSSEDKPQQINEKSLDIPMYWVKPQPILSSKSGEHRWIWDVHYTPVVQARMGRRGGGGVWAVPGSYTVRLTADGKSYSQPLTVQMDPRVKATPAELEAQFLLSQRLAKDVAEVAKSSSEASEIEKQLRDLKSKPSAASTILANFTKQFEAISGPPPEGYGTPVMPLNTDHTSFRYLGGALGQVYGAVQSADVAPTPDQQHATEQLETQMKSTVADWQRLVASDLPKLNAELKQAGLTEINLAAKPK